MSENSKNPGAFNTSWVDADISKNPSHTFLEGEVIFIARKGVSMQSFTGPSKKMGLEGSNAVEVMRTTVFTLSTLNQKLAGEVTGGWEEVMNVVDMIAFAGVVVAPTSRSTDPSFFRITYAYSGMPRRIVNYWGKISARYEYGFALKLRAILNNGAATGTFSLQMVPVRTIHHMPYSELDRRLYDPIVDRTGALVPGPAWADNLSTFIWRIMVPPSTVSADKGLKEESKASIGALNLTQVNPELLRATGDALHKKEVFGRRDIFIADVQLANKPWKRL